MDHVLRHRRPRRRATALLAGLVAALLAASMSPARAEAPTATAKALTLAAPGVVSVDVRAKVSVTLHRAFRDLVATRTFTYSTRPLTGGSGMVVAPDYLVTASHVVDFDEELKDVARIYAANRLFFQRLRLDQLFGEVRGDDLYREQRLSDPGLDQVLQDCYNEDICKFDVKPNVSVIAPVQVGGAKPKALPAQVRANTHFDGGDVAALQVIDSQVPLATVPLATTAGDLQPGQSIVAMGFPASHTKILPNGTTEPSSSFGHVSNVTSDGSTQVIEVDIRAESGASGGPAIDDQGKVVGMVSYTGLDETGGRTQVYLQTADNIRSVLREAGVQPTRGELDTAFAEAMDYYWAGHYSAALPEFQKVMDLQDGHILARKYLRLAQAKAGGPDDVPLPSSAAAAKGRGPLVWGLVALAVLVVVALLLGALAWRRRRRAEAGPAYPPASADTGRVVLEPWDDVDRQPPMLDHDAEPAPAVDPGEVAGNSQPAPRPAAVMVQDAEPQARGFCPYCGTRLAPEARFCSGCGRPQ